MVRHGKGLMSHEHVLSLIRSQKHNADLVSEQPRQNFNVCLRKPKEWLSVSSHMPSSILSSSWLICLSFVFKREGLDKILTLQVQVLQDVSHCWKEKFERRILHSKREEVFICVRSIFHRILIAKGAQKEKDLILLVPSAAKTKWLKTMGMHSILFEDFKYISTNFRSISLLENAAIYKYVISSVWTNLLF